MCTGERALTKAGNLKQPTRQDVVNWVSSAWKSITVETLIHSFLVCGLANASQDEHDVPAVDAAAVAEEQ